MIDFAAENREMEEEFRKLVPEYPIHFLDLSAFEHFEFFKTELRPLLELFKRRDNKEKFVKYIEEHKSDWKMNDESWFMLSQLTHSKTLKSLIKEKGRAAGISKKEGESEGKNMLKALDDWANDAKAEGKAESIIDFLEVYGEIPDSLRDEILNQKNLEIMQRWVKLAARAGSIQNFIQGMHAQN